ncbi:MAG: GxxExxY protein [Opitutaceae bacterium]|nr:GxxExxY protein [Cephaloticoccus sp.]MCP5531345.1 GxxExxY protein [Opitutaceae bacterium]
MNEINQLTEQIIGAAIEVHRVKGPGLLESAYEACLAHELALRGIGSLRQVSVPLSYKGVVIETAFRADLIIKELVLVELKAVETILPVHRAQVLSYIRETGHRVGLLINCHVPKLVDGVTRIINDRPLAE